MPCYDHGWCIYCKQYLFWLASLLAFTSNHMYLCTHDMKKMLDLVAQVNLSLLTGVVVQDNNYALYKVVDSLLELNAGSTAFLVGMFLGHTASEMQEAGQTPSGASFLHHLLSLRYF